MLFANLSLPEQASTLAADVDFLYNFVMWLSIITCVTLMGVMLYFAVKYRRRGKDDRTPYIAGSPRVEFLWTVIPAIIFLGISIWGIIIFHKLENPPANAFAIHVTGKQWFWEFTYGNGKKTVNEVTVPLGQPIVMQMTSGDVLHSFFVPSFRVKKDLVPGYRTQLWFTPTKAGEFHLFCAEYCGTNHSRMLGKVKVLPRDEFFAWYGKKKEGETGLADLGADLYKSKGCFSCHTVDGSPLVGPSFKGVWESPREFTDGSHAKVDANYIRDSILNPAAQVVKGFPPVMPPYQGQLTEEEITQIIEYLKTL